MKERGSGAIGTDCSPIDRSPSREEIVTDAVTKSAGDNCVLESQVARITIEGATNIEGLQYACEQCGEIFSGSARDVDRSPRSSESCTHPKIKIIQTSPGKRTSQRYMPSAEDITTEETHPSVFDDSNSTQEFDNFELYICFECKSKFKTQENLQAHQPCQRKFECVNCGKRFPTRSRLKRHQVNKGDCATRNLNWLTDGQNRTKCKECGKSFNNTGALNVHMLIHRNEKPFSCSECDKSFNQAGNLRTHIKTVHEKIKSFLCSFCGKKFSTKNGLEYHLRCHMEDRIQKEYEEFMRQKRSSDDDRKVLLETDQLFSCHVCLATFNNVFQWLHHLKDHLEGEKMTEAEVEELKELVDRHKDGFKVKVFPCQICRHVVYSAAELKNHQVSVHKGDTALYKCEHCNREFKAKRALKVHEQSHTQKFQLCCEMCGEGFPKRDKLRYHMFKVHNQQDLEKLHRCQFCQTVFRTHNLLETHLRSAHDKPKAFKCDKCTKTFATKYSLDVHIRTHTNQKPYKCTHCPRSFADQSNLIHHGTKVHPAAFKSDFHRLKGWTDEKMDQVAANTVLSIDSRQLEAMHELSSLENVEPLLSPSKKLPLSIDIVEPGTSRTVEASKTSGLGGDVVATDCGSGLLVEGGVQFFQLMDESGLSPAATAQAPMVTVDDTQDAPLATPPLPKDIAHEDPSTPAKSPIMELRSTDLMSQSEDTGNLGYLDVHNYATAQVVGGNGSNHGNGLTTRGLMTDLSSLNALVEASESADDVNLNDDEDGAAAASPEDPDPNTQFPPTDSLLMSEDLPVPPPFSDESIMLRNPHLNAGSLGADRSTLLQGTDDEDDNTREILMTQENLFCISASDPSLTLMDTDDTKMAPSDDMFTDLPDMHNEVLLDGNSLLETAPTPPLLTETPPAEKPMEIPAVQPPQTGNNVMLAPQYVQLETAEGLQLVQVCAGNHGNLVQQQQTGELMYLVYV